MVNAGPGLSPLRLRLANLLYSSVMDFSTPKATQGLVTLRAGFGMGPGFSGQMVSHTGLSVVGT